MVGVIFSGTRGAHGRSLFHLDVEGIPVSYLISDDLFKALVEQSAPDLQSALAKAPRLISCLAFSSEDILDRFEDDPLFGSMSVKPLLPEDWTARDTRRLVTDLCDHADMGGLGEMVNDWLDREIRFMIAEFMEVENAE